MKTTFIILTLILFVFAANNLILAKDKVQTNKDDLKKNTKPQPKDSIDHSSKYPLPYNQGNQVSSASWAVAYLKTFLEAKEMNWDVNDIAHQFSPAFIYNQINEGVDSGCYMEDALNVVKEIGCCPMKVMPYDEKDYKTKPNYYQLTVAQRYKAKDWEKIDFNDISKLKDTLKKGDSFVLALEVYQNFLNLGKNEVWQDKKGDLIGYYGICVVGYDDGMGKNGAFKVINSRGVEWGTNGFGWISYDMIGMVSKGAYILIDQKNPTIKELPVPKNVKSSDGEYCDYIHTTWDSGNVNGYCIFRSETENGDYTYVNSIKENQYYDYTNRYSEKNLYFYKVMAFSLEGESPLSEADSGWRIGNLDSKSGKGKADKEASKKPKEPTVDELKQQIAKLKSDNEKLVKDMENQKTALKKDIEKSQKDTQEKNKKEAQQKADAQNKLKAEIDGYKESIKKGKDEAQQLTKQITNLKDGYAKAINIFEKGLVEFNAGKYESALQLFDEAIQVYPGQPVPKLFSSSASQTKAILKSKEELKPKEEKEKEKGKQ